jgi:ubiquinone/menaquinone biosynthesis C-methylase UbiE
MTSGASLSHAEKVKAFFEAPEGYFERREFDIRIRADTVRAFTSGRTFAHALDIGCGNGAVSLPLIREGRCRKLTLLDMSAAMLGLARAQVSPREHGQVEFVNGDFLALPFGTGKFDLVLCIGVLAHVACPSVLIEKIARLLKPGGSLLIEITDSHHPVGAAFVLYHAVLGWFRPAAYRLNKVGIGEISSICSRHRLLAAACYRYAVPPPGSHRIFSHDTLYDATRAVFGDATANRRRWLGNVAICRFDAAGERPLP